VEIKIEFKGQTYRLTKSVPFVFGIDRESIACEWTSNCPDCQAEFTFKNGPTLQMDRIRRRCDDCKAPGKRVPKTRPLQTAPRFG